MRNTAMIPSRAFDSRRNVEAPGIFALSPQPFRRPDPGSMRHHWRKAFSDSAPWEPGLDEVSSAHRLSRKQVIPQLTR
jgi:hypothetical protein